MSWIGSRQGIEKKIVESWGGEYRSISTGKLRRYFSFQNFTDIFRIAAGFFQSLRILGDLKPALVFSKGRVCLCAPVAAAKFRKIPSFTHDSDVVPGLATKINHKMTVKTFLAYEESRSYLGDPAGKIVVSGNPVREEFFDADQSMPREWAERIGAKPLLMVLGGSSGARQVNDLVRESLDQLLEKIHHYPPDGGCPV